MFSQFQRLQRCYGIKKLMPRACLNLDNDAVTRGTLNPRAPVSYCSRGSPCTARPKYQRPVAPVSPPSPKPVCSKHKRNCPPGGH
ncbi:hypothetical protein PanWU01x14_296370 [Parasponia andersonii]|uniref:Uncharacterized protein n=1 Tax=Parasponia andersonii TaxID=3476 RepID=A0A2P5AVS0_PARAD|nr:hypothetical protein PanWU01x14_296370 [Parasponia andersonii]